MQRLASRKIWYYTTITIAITTTPAPPPTCQACSIFFSVLWVKAQRDVWCDASSCLYRDALMMKYLVLLPAMPPEVPEQLAPTALAPPPPLPPSVLELVAPVVVLLLLLLSVVLVVVLLWLLLLLRLFPPIPIPPTIPLLAGGGGAEDPPGALLPPKGTPNFPPDAPEPILGADWADVWLNPGDMRVLALVLVVGDWGSLEAVCWGNLGVGVCWGAGGLAASLVLLEDEWLDCESSEVPTDQPPSVWVKCVSERMDERMIGGGIRY
ncbi:hypothetical protein E2C01_039331 [Portunus trituberculatus]|uniref:Uncharacterized protein n=1 Tax=Portunus trituberculatus TaxID=210409 RepID=A0A5B7FJF1_PORTR|nr:hypothetical protein [Portunus trituberculatus]